MLMLQQTFTVVVYKEYIVFKTTIKIWGVRFIREYMVFELMWCCPCTPIFMYDMVMAT